MKIYILIIVSFVIFNSCSPKADKKKLSKSNPTEYIFSMNRYQLNQIILKNFLHFEVLQTPDTMMVMFLYNAELEKIYRSRKCKFDVVCGNLTRTKSKLYFSDSGEPLEYLISYYLALDSIDQNTTKVIVYSVGRELIVGRESMPSLSMGMQLRRKEIIQKVEPSTIEEYEILLNIGKYSGEQNMPAIILPSKD